MKLAEALILRADLQKRIEQIKSRLMNNILVQEGDQPSEDPKSLIQEFTGTQKELTEIIKKINKTNNTTRFNEQLLLSDALVERDRLLETRSLFSNAVTKASEKTDRYSRTEIKHISTINVKDYQDEVNRLSKEYRELDTGIQRLNWIVDLV